MFLEGLNINTHEEKLKYLVTAHFTHLIIGNMATSTNWEQKYDTTEK